MFKVGDKVVCVKAWHESEQQGQTYTVAYVSEGAHGASYIKLSELMENAPIHNFAASRYAHAELSLVPKEADPSGISLNTTGAAIAGRKDDSGKLDMTLIDDMPRALEAVVEVMQWAITKKQPMPYMRGSWQGVSADRYRAAVLRHNSAAAKQATGNTIPARLQRDNETDLLHLAHMACSALFALELALREHEEIVKV